MTLEILSANKILHEIANVFESKLPRGEINVFSNIHLFYYFFPNLRIFGFEVTYRFFHFLHFLHYELE